MKLPCAVVRDLLPLYAEKLTEEETERMLEAHLAECAACRRKLTEMDSETVSSARSVKPLMALKREIRGRRRRAALMAALCVFAGVYTWFFHASGMRPVPWQEGLIEVVRVETLQSSDGRDGGSHVPEEEVPGATAAPFDDTHEGEALILKVSSFINGFSEYAAVEKDGTKTVVLQAVSSNTTGTQQAGSAYEMTYRPVPDRLIYGFEEPRKLLWGPAPEGTEALSRPPLPRFLIAASLLSALCGLAWVIFRKWRYGWILRQVFLVPFSLALSRLLLKGTGGESFFAERDTLGILLLSAALYVLMTLGWQALMQRRRETA